MCNKNFIASVFTYLVEHMHIAINKVVEGRQTEDLSCTMESESILFYAEEAYELGDFSKARNYYTKVNIYCYSILKVCSRNL